MHTWESLGVRLPRILLPGKGTTFETWSVVACDQYTSQKDYWQDVEMLVGDRDSTLHLILPELYLEEADVARRIGACQANMRDVLQRGVLREMEPGAVLVRRLANGQNRAGLVVALDLEAYDYAAGSASLIRPTEGTIVERIPPRLRIREGACLELPHIIVLIDDPGQTVIEPLLRENHETLYDFELMKDGGRVRGDFVLEGKLEGARAALSSLLDQAVAKGGAPLLYAVGDGNHSLATAAAYWQKVKAGLSSAEQQDHPARFALVELENVHDPGIVFEPIHRVLFGVPDDILQRLETIFREQNPDGACIDAVGNVKDVEKVMAGKGHMLPYLLDGKRGVLCVLLPKHQLAVGTLQNALDVLLKECSGVSVDYIHGADVVESLSRQPGNMGFLLPDMRKEDLFASVSKDGPLPRKTFSMGEANEKRYYLECRKIV